MIPMTRGTFRGLVRKTVIPERWRDMAEYGLGRRLDTGDGTGGMTLDEAILWSRADPSSAALVTDSYLGRDVAASADRFLRSAEFAEVKRLLGSMLHHAVVADIGAGTGIASHALLSLGASRVLAVEPPNTERSNQRCAYGHSVTLSRVSGGLTPGELPGTRQSLQ